MSDIKAVAEQAKAWPFEEARKLLKRLNKNNIENKTIIFETGYGPSGLPHIGTFGEVARTTMVRKAFEQISDLPTKLIAFSDDMDGLRKVPDNIPEKEMVAQHLGKPLTAIPDPFGTHNSFGEHNNARLKSFLDQYGFDYDFYSATECYKAGVFDETLLAVLHNYQAVLDIILPTLGAERRATYSPFLPVCEKTGKVLQAVVKETKAESGLIIYENEDGDLVETPVTGGHCKLQWKVDWAMRWSALGVDYEMAGKDLIESVHLSSRITKVLKNTPPEGFSYELFLDEKGEKISKSVGNGISVEEWLRYAPHESLSLFMFQHPRRAKRLYFDVIPKAVEEYYTFLKKIQDEELPKKFENPVWHIHQGNPPKQVPSIGFNLLLNLAGACHAEDKSILWGFISRYADATPETDPELDKLVGYALNYYQDFILPTKEYRKASEKEESALSDLAEALKNLDNKSSAQEFQQAVYDVGKAHAFESLKDWFSALYEILLGQKQGPRMGSFIALYGRDETIKLIDRAVKGQDISA